MKKKLMNKEGITQDDLERIEQEERDAMNLDCTKAINASMKKVEDLKLTKTQEILLRKIVDFSTLQNYDSEEIRNNLYKLFFEWNKDMKKSDGTDLHGNDSKEDVTSQNPDKETNEDKEEKKKA